MVQHNSTSVRCEKCNKDFEMRETKLQRRNLDDGIEETYFNCPLCNELFSVMKTNIEIRTLISKQNYMRDKLRRAGRLTATDATLKIFKDRQAEIMRLSDILNGKVNQDGKQLS